MRSSFPRPLSRRLRALLVACLFLAAWSVASLPIQARAQDAAAPADLKYPVLQVTGDDVNLRCGPSIDHHAVGTVSRGQWLLEVGRDGEFVRVRVPGGVPAYVFGTLLDWGGRDRDDTAKGAPGEPPPLRCRVSADDVLIRATPTTRHYPFHDQKLARGAELVVLGTEDTDEGRWLRVVSPPAVHVWIHERYVRPADPVPGPAEIARSAEQRLDELTGGRTRQERESHAAERRAADESRLAVLRAQIDAGKCDAALEQAARDLAAATDDDDVRIRALALAERAVGLREAAEAKRAARERADAEQAQRAREDAERRRAEAEAAQRRREQVEAERRRREREEQRRDRGPPEGVGVLRVRGADVLLEQDGKALLELHSPRFRLADFAGRTVRVWGTRETRENARDRLEVTSIEIVRTGGE